MAKYKPIPLYVSPELHDFIQTKAEEANMSMVKYLLTKAHIYEDFRKSKEPADTTPKINFD